MGERVLGVSGVGWTIALLVGVSCFFLTLALTEPPSTVDTILLNNGVKDEASLAAALDRVGLSTSQRARGNIDQLIRMGGNVVKATGWAAEIGGRSNPLTVIIFTAGGRSYSTKAIGSRPDVSAALGLSPEAASNVAFQLLIRCTPGEALLAGAVAPEKLFGRLTFREQTEARCP